MADLINLTPTPVLVTGGGSPKLMPVEQAIDVSAYDRLDLVIDIPGGAPSTVKLLTSMTLQEDDNDWIELATTSGTLPDRSFNNYLTAPGSSGVPMLRYVRWKITPGASNGSATISGLARRG